MTWLELIFSILAWMFQVGVVLLIAALIGLASAAVEAKLRKRSVKRVPRILVVFVLLCAVLAALAVNPPVICPKDMEAQMTDELFDHVQSGASGLYSWKLPLVPLCVKITGIEPFLLDGKTERVVEFSVCYFSFGVLKMEYSTSDGYNAYPMFGQ